MHWKPLFEDSRPGSKSDIYICIGTTHKTFRTSSEQRENVRSSMGLKRSDFPTCWEVSAALQRTDLRSLPPLHVQKLTQQLKTFEGYRLMSIGSKSFSSVSQNLLVILLKIIISKIFFSYSLNINTSRKILSPIWKKILYCFQ